MAKTKQPRRRQKGHGLQRGWGWHKGRHVEQLWTSAVEPLNQADIQVQPRAYAASKPVVSHKAGKRRHIETV